MEKTENYYLGLDMGTTSLGWAVTNENYELLRACGKDLWGVRLFEEAKTAVERRTNRGTRRRIARESARIGMLRYFFSDAIEAVDPGFYQRMDESKYWLEDRSESNHQRNAIFADKNYSDKEYYAEYKTIFHLRKELIESKEPHDVRLVYLAVLNIFKHRGHFLNKGDLTISSHNIATQWPQLCLLAQDLELKFVQTEIGPEMEKLLSDNGLSRTRKCEKLLELNKLKKTNKREYEFLKLLCGVKAKCQILFGNEITDEEMLKKSFSFQDADYETIATELESMVSEETWELVEKIKEIHDIALLSKIQKGQQYLSQARVVDYEKHDGDLKLLQELVKKYCPEEYDSFFRVMGKDNYSAYVGSVNSKLQKVRRCEENGGKALSREDFYNSVKKLLKKMPDTEEGVKHILDDIDKENFLPKQLTASNGVIPNQMHEAELKVILENASTYLPFLNEKKEGDLTVKEMIDQLFQFQIPYYVGPLNATHKGKGGTAWVVRKELGRVFPWNFEKKVDLKASREEFIHRMVRQCSYLRNEKVLPKNSLLYEKFMVLNELNNLKVRNEKISVELKQEIYQELFETGKKVTNKKLREFLVTKGYIQAGETNVISGIDQDFKASLSSYGKFYAVLGERMKEFDVQQAVEKIIFWGTVYSNDKVVVKECILEKYPELFTETELKKVLGFKYKEWGRLSKEFLELDGADKETGEVMPIWRRLWETNENLMQLLSIHYTYAEELEERAVDANSTLKDFKYEDMEDFNLSAPVKRMVWQTILVLKDLEKALGGEPKKVFVEMTRGGGTKGERKQSRQKKFKELYEKCGDEKELLGEIQNLTDADLRKKKLYLYYLQKGRDLYTGKEISLSNLFNENLYDIDHIYPRHFVKDDNIENNLVLVDKSYNAHKSDGPLDEKIQKSQFGFWKALHEQGFMNDEKFRRLTRKGGFTDEEKAGFIARQLVETSQGTKVMTQILKELFKDSEIVFPKGGNVSEFRHKFDLLKVRNVNDFHHAQDAYLNIVVGNAYLTKFTNNPINYIKDYNRDPKKYAYHLGRMFEKDICRNGVVVWLAPTKEDKEKGTISIVKNVMAKNSPLLTRMNFEGHGGLTGKETVYGKNKAKNNVYFPLKTNDIRLADVEKYGGKMGTSTAYFFVVEHLVKKERIRTIEVMPIYLVMGRKELSNEEMMKYCTEKLGLVDPKICWKKIKIQSLIKRNGFYLHIAGKSETRFTVRNAVPMYLSQNWINYIKKLNGYVEKKLTENDVSFLSKEKNKELFNILAEKHIDGIYSKKPNPISEKIKEWREIFMEADLESQIEALVELLKMTECANNEMNAKKLKFTASHMLISKNVSKTDEYLLINQSPSGIYESMIDLKTV